MNHDEPPRVPRVLNNDLFFNLDRASLLYRRRLLDHTEDKQSSPESIEILRLLQTQGPTKQSELTSVTMRDKGNLSRLLKRLLQDGLVQRQTLANKQNMLLLTVKGQKVLSQKLPGMDAEKQQLLALLSEAEFAELILSLKKLRILLGDDAV